MAQFLVTTSGTQSPVVLNDLGGRSLIHPVVSLDLLLEFSQDELAQSADLQSALTGGHLTAVDQNSNPITAVGEAETQDAAEVPYDNTTSGLVATDVQAAIDETAAGGGISAAQHEALDTLIHLIAENAYEEINYSGDEVASVVVWTDSGKTKKIRETLYTYSGDEVATETVKQYDGTGALDETLTGTYVYSGDDIANITWVKT